MCCFSRPVEHVSGTQIFARPLAGGAQALAYSMSFAAAGDLAMILPLPVPPGPAEDAVRFIDLEGYPGLFADLRRAFPTIMAAPSRGVFAAAAPQPAAILKVHDVGSFEASFVPTLADFDRLDERFRLSPAVWEQLPGYRDWGFAVFKLKRKPVGLMRRLLGRPGAPQTVHPMAFTFPRRDPRSLFFPTVHVHDGAVHPEARFDHTLYCQPDELTAETFGWERSEPLGEHVDVERARGLIDGERPCYRRVLTGSQPNVDVELSPPQCDGVASLRRVGRCFELRLQARANYDLAPADERAARRRETARHHLDAVALHLVDALDGLVAERAGDWGLCPYDEALPSRTLIGGQLFGESVALLPDGSMRPIEPVAPLRVAFAIESDSVEPQHVWLSFAEIPHPGLLARIESQLSAALSELAL
jgi:hypothetical protein